jgi:predicted restriction endonuclease
MEHYGPKCAICGYDTESCLEVHHVDGNRGNNEITNLLVVCPTHHVEIERGIITV